MKDFTLIEWMIVICIVGVLFSALIPAFFIDKTNISYGINGFIENRCVNGFSFIIDQKGRATQILDSFGKGVSCVTN